MTDKIKATHKIKASSMFAMALLFLLASFTLGSLSASSNALHVYDLRPGSEGTFIREIHDVNGRVMLIGYNDSSAKLYVQRDTDSFEAIFTPSENDVVNESISMNDLYFFTTYNFDSYLAKLWVSDGTSEGTNMLLDSPLDGIGFNSIRNLLTINNHLYFTAIDPDLGKEVWQSDGTPEGTAVFADINPGSSSSIQASSIDQLNRPTMMSNYGSRIYVYADDGIHGYELWRIDTGSGNYELVKDINSGPDSSFPNDFYTFKGFTYFRANDGIHGFELWRTDGTSQNTTLVADINRGEGGSSPGYFNSA
ncbi:MAG: ELWxxDGT repeat protein, partial [Chloroflexota bacterium]